MYHPGNFDAVVSRKVEDDIPRSRYDMTAKMTFVLGTWDPCVGLAGQKLKPFLQPGKLLVGDRLSGLALVEVPNIVKVSSGGTGKPV